MVTRVELILSSLWVCWEGDDQGGVSRALLGAKSLARISSKSIQSNLDKRGKPLIKVEYPGIIFAKFYNTMRFLSKLGNHRIY